MRQTEKKGCISTIFSYENLNNVQFGTLHSRVKRTHTIQLFPSIIPRRLFEDQWFRHEQAILQMKLRSRGTHSGERCVVLPYTDQFFFSRHLRYENLTQYFKEERARELVIDRYLAGIARTVSRCNSTIYNNITQEENSECINP